MPIAAFLPLAISLAAKFAPALVGKLMGSDAEKTAEKVMGAASEISGIADPQGAHDAIMADPKEAADFQVRMNEIELEITREDTKRFEEYHKTLRGDVASSDEYARRWRPKFGYYMAYSWLIMFIILLGVTIAGLFKVVNLSEAVRAYGELIKSMELLWGVALAVLGVNIKKRSDDKRAVLGETRPGFLRGIIEAIRK